MGAWTLIAFTALAVCLQAYACLATFMARRAQLPPNFGNFPGVREALPSTGNSGPLTFVMVGDTRSTGTFESLAGDIGEVDPAFIVILGDWVNGGSADQHAYYRQEAAEFGFRCPVFFTPGNHDVDPEEYPLNRFENDYGPRNFSFVYNNNLFIFISHLDKRFSNTDSLNYLRSMDRQKIAAYDNRFVFMHIPPWVTPDIKKRHTKDEKQIIGIFHNLGINYVIAGDFHGYNRTNLNGVEYIVTGGGGAHLDDFPGTQFHHAVALTVDKGMISERIIPGAPHFDLGEWMEEKSIVYIGPFILRYAPFFLFMNLLVAFAARATLRSTGTTQRISRHTAADLETACRFGALAGLDSVLKGPSETCRPEKTRT